MCVYKLAMTANKNERTRFCEDAGITSPAASQTLSSVCLTPTCTSTQVRPAVMGYAA